MYGTNYGNFGKYRDMTLKHDCIAIGYTLYNGINGRNGSKDLGYAINE